MDRRRVELQIRAVLIVFRAQRDVGDGDAIAAIRMRGHAIFTGLEPWVAGDPELERQLAEARRELDDSVATER